MAQMYQMEASQIEGMIPEEQKENMKKDIAVQKAVEFETELGKCNRSY